MLTDRRLLVLAHSGPARDRAFQLFDSRSDAEIVETGGGRRGALTAARLLARSPARVIYLIDVGVSTTVAAVVGRLLRRRVILDTGDLVFALERSRGSRGPIDLAVVWLGERLAVACAHAVVVRGLRHGDFLSRAPIVAPDLAPEGARPVAGLAVRRALGLEDTFVVGLVGSLHRAPSLGTTYGWDLVEALGVLPADIHGLVVGDGDGRQDLEARARELGVAERLHLVGRVEGEAVLAYVGSMDLALSTQTNDAVGAVRTTGKLPFYLACGCPVLASDVGEAHRLLRPLGWTVRYDGVVDRAYPRRLAARIVQWRDDGAAHERRRAAARRLFEQHFDPAPIVAAVHGLVATQAESAG